MIWSIFGSWSALKSSCFWSFYAHQKHHTFPDQNRTTTASNGIKTIYNSSLTLLAVLIAKNILTIVQIWGNFSAFAGNLLPFWCSFGECRLKHWEQARWWSGPLITSTRHRSEFSRHINAQVLNLELATCDSYQSSLSTLAHIYKYTCNWGILLYPNRMMK